jgi:hypothetical protein
MENPETGEKNEKPSPPLQIDPKWYVRHAALLESMTAETAKLPRRTQNILPTNQER